jgi:hypothetical protein
VTKLEADELEKFRRNIAAAELPHLLRVVETTLDDYLDLLRNCGAPDALRATVLALGVELCVRAAQLESPPIAQAPVLVGNA